MSEYISREAANEACLEAVRRYPNSFYNGIEAARDAIRKLPAADVRPVERGKWEHDEMGADICSVCQNYAFESSTHHLCGWEPNFCPNCGADMRGESDA